MCLTMQVLGQCRHVEYERVLPCDTLITSQGQRCKETEVAFQWIQEDCYLCEGRMQRPLDYLVRKITELRNLGRS